MMSKYSMYRKFENLEKDMIDNAIGFVIAEIGIKGKEKILNCGNLLRDMLFI